MQNPIQIILRFQIFQVFFQKLIFFTVSIPYTAQVRKVQSAKKSLFSPLLWCKIRFRPFYDFRTFSSFFSENQFFSLFRTLYCKGEKYEVRKKSFLVLFDSAKSNSDHFTLSNFSIFIFKNKFFYCFDPLYCTGEKSAVSKKSLFSPLLWCKIRFRPFYDFRTFSKFFQKINFFHCFEPYIAKVRNMTSDKNPF